MRERIDSLDDHSSESSDEVYIPQRRGDRRNRQEEPVEEEPVEVAEKPEDAELELLKAQKLSKMDEEVERIRAQTQKKKEDKLAAAEQPVEVAKPAAKKNNKKSAPKTEAAAAPAQPKKAKKAAPAKEQAKKVVKEEPKPAPVKESSEESEPEEIKPVKKEVKKAKAAPQPKEPKANGVAKDHQRKNGDSKKADKPVKPTADGELVPEAGKKIVKVMAKKKTVKDAAGGDDWEVTDKRDTYAIQKPIDSSDDGSELSYD